MESTLEKAAKEFAEAVAATVASRDRVAIAAAALDAASAEEFEAEKRLGAARAGLLAVAGGRP